MTTATANPLNPTQQQALEGFMGAVLGRLADSLRMFLGRDVSMTVNDVAILDSTGIRMRMPDAAAGLSVHLDGADALVIALLEPPLSHSLSHLARLGAPEGLEALRAAPPSTSDDDLEQLRTASGFLAAALNDAWPSTGSGESSDVILVVDNSWQSDEDPLGERDYVHVDAHCTLEGFPKDPVSLVVPLSAAEAFVPALADGHDGAAPGQDNGPDSEPDAGTEGAHGAQHRTDAPPARPNRPATDLGQPIPVVCIDAEEVADHVASQLENGAVERLADIHALEAWLQAGRVPALVIARVPSGADEDLEALARLKREHLLRGHPVLLVLDDPVKATVLRCGRLGLVNAVPARAHPNVAWRRVAMWLRHRPATAGTR